MLIEKSQGGGHYECFCGDRVRVVGPDWKRTQRPKSPSSSESEEEVEVVDGSETGGSKRPGEEAPKKEETHDEEEVLADSDDEDDMPELLGRARVQYDDGEDGRVGEPANRSGGNLLG